MLATTYAAKLRGWILPAIDETMMMLPPFPCRIIACAAALEA